MRCQALTFPGVPSLSSHHPLITCTWNPSSHNIPISGLGLIILNVPKAKRGQRYWLIPRAYRSTLKFEEDEEESSHGSSSESDQLSRFEAAVKLFNEREYYACHDLLESLWFDSYDPRRTLFHALLQCAVGFYHLFNQVGPVFFSSLFNPSFLSPLTILDFCTYIRRCFVKKKKKNK